MSIYVVKVQLPYEGAASRLAIFHSNSETMFSPVFGEDEELAANMFAAHFEAHRSRSPWTDYSETAQESTACAVRAFITAHNLLDESSPIPAPWLATWGEQYNNPEPSDVSDLVWAFERSYPVADLLMGEFHAWQKKAPHVKVPHGLCRVCGHYGEDCTGAAA